MLTLTRGQKVSLSHAPSHLRVRFSVQAPGLTLDFSCFGLSDKGQLLDERYFIFYNQKQSPEGALRMVSDTDFELELDRLPSAIQKLVFVVTVDGLGELQQMESGFFGIWSHGGQVARFDFRGTDFGREKAVMITEIYRREGWRMAAVGQGFVGGLDAVLSHFGGKAEEENTVSASASGQFDSGHPRSLACVRCGKHATSWVDLRKFDSDSGRCTHCVAEVQSALDGLRREFLSASQSGILRDDTWQAMWKHFDTARQKISHEEALTFLRPDTLAFVERLLAMAGADGVVTPAAEQYIKQMLNAFAIPAEYQRPFKARLQRFKSIAQIRGGYLPVITNKSYILDSGELCHLAVPAIYRKVITKQSSDTQGTLLATSKRLMFMPSSNSSTGVSIRRVAYKNIFEIKEATNSVYLGLSSGSGNGHYFVDDTAHTEAVIMTLTLMAKRQLLGPQEELTRYIPQDVRNAVWQRDGGKCRRCGSKSYLEFDHDIPHSKGGANTIGNVQLLCRKCNLAKGDRI